MRTLVTPSRMIDDGEAPQERSSKVILGGRLV
jgi:hypothetical protein